MKKTRIFLSRRNLQVLLSKLDRQAAGEETACTIIKFRNEQDAYPQELDEITITAIEDQEYYRDRPAGVMHPQDCLSKARDERRFFIHQAKEYMKLRGR